MPESRKGLGLWVRREGKEGASSESHGGRQEGYGSVTRLMLTACLIRSFCCE